MSVDAAKPAKPQAKILVLAFVMEGLFAAIFFCWWYFSDYPISFRFDWLVLLQSVLAIIPIWIANLLLMRLIRREDFPRTKEFIKEVVEPMVAQLSTVGILLVSVAAGVGEELFFRGVLYTELGLIASSVCFALAHFGLRSAHFGLLFLVYSLIGAYFAWLFSISQTLVLPVLSHVIYDCTALLWISRGLNRVK